MTACSEAPASSGSSTVDTRLRKSAAASKLATPAPLPSTRESSGGIVKTCSKLSKGQGNERVKGSAAFKGLTATHSKF